MLCRLVPVASRETSLIAEKEHQRPYEFSFSHVCSFFAVPEEGNHIGVLRPKRYVAYLEYVSSELEGIRR